MKFYVIYDFDLCRDLSVKRYKPRGKQWQLTETDSEYEYNYLADESYNPKTSTYRHGKHRKYVALLTRIQFEDFLKNQWLYPEDTETMGSITGFGWLPAISFNNSNPNYGVINQSAYVTPIPEILGKEIENGTDRDWKRIRKSVISYYNKL